MKQPYYLIGVQGGVDPFVQGPYQEEDDSLFWADFDEVSGLSVGPYKAGFFWR